MRYGYSLSEDYGINKVVVRDFKSTPPGRVLCIIARDNAHEAEQIAVRISDLLNQSESETNGND
jgi:hypothetical protein